MDKKTIGLIFGMIFLVMTISCIQAWDFDNVKSTIEEKKDLYLTTNKTIKYNELWDKYKPIEIKNAFGFGKTNFKGAITEHTEKCGIDCHSVIELTHSGGVLIQDIQFKGDKPRNYNILIKNETKVLVNDYEKRCENVTKEFSKINNETGENETYYKEVEECEKVKVGEHYEKRTKYSDYEIGTEIKEGNYELKIEGSININSNVDWQIKTHGDWLNEWAWWNSTYDERYKINPNGSGYSGIGSVDVNLSGQYVTIGNDTATGDVYFYNNTETGDWAIANETTELCGFNSETGEVYCPLLTGSAEGLVAHYPLDGSSGDVWCPINTSNNGTANGGINRGVTGQVINAFDFDGTDDYADVGVGDGNGQEDRTISFWFKAPSSGQSQSKPTFIGSMGGSNNYGLWVSFNDMYSDNTNTGKIYLGVRWSSGNSQQVYFDGNSYEDDTWHHAVAVFDVSETGTIGDLFTLYVDGDSKTLTTERDQGTGSDFGGARNMEIARTEYPQTDALFEGLMDNVRVYNRLLSSTEVSNLYSSTSSNKPYFEASETFNNPPNQPKNPNPSDGATGVSTTTTLSADLTDPDGDTMNASFYWSNDTLIEEVTGITNGSTATTSSLSLNTGTTYNWYVNATDGTATNQSDTWSFTTNYAPNITLNSPENDYVAKADSNTITFNCSVSDDQKVENVSLYVDGSINETNTSGINDTDYIWDKTLDVGSHNWTCEAYDNQSQSTKPTTRNFTIINLTINAPENETTIYNPYVLLNATAYGGENMNLSFYSSDEKGYCYQESANVSNQSGTDGDCSLNYGGSYSGNVFPNMTDGDWSSYSSSFLSGDVFYVNYSKPKNVGLSAIWRTKTGINERNQTIIDSCLDHYSNKIRLKVSHESISLGDSNYTYYCYNGSFVKIDNFIASLGVEYFYEEAIYWDYGLYENLSVDNEDNILYNWTGLTGNKTYKWFAELTYNNASIKSDVYQFSTESVAPSITSVNNLSGLLTDSFPINSKWNYTVTGDKISACYYNTSDDTSYSTITCNSTITTSWSSRGQKNITYCVNDTLGNENCNSSSIYVHETSYTQSADRNSVGEGSDITFYLNVTLDGEDSIPSTTANLIFNGTTYSTGTISNNGTHYFFSRKITVGEKGSLSGNELDWNWNYTLNGVINNVETTTQTIDVYSVDIDNCSSYSDILLNMTLTDEETNERINATNNKIEADVLITSKNGNSLSWNYSNTWNNETDANALICVPNNLLNNSEYRIDFTLGYNADGYVQEFYYLDNGDLNSSDRFNSLTEKEIFLRDLALSDSTSFLFNYFDEDSLPVSNAIVHVHRKYIGEGIFREVERSKEDDNGDTITHLVEEDVIYYFTITLNGEILYVSDTYTALCQSTPCTITLEARGDFQDIPSEYDLIDEGEAYISVDNRNRIVNLTYSLNTPQQMNLSISKYLGNGSYEQVATGNSYGTSGKISLKIPQTAGNQTFFASIYKNNKFIRSVWVDLEEKLGDYLGTTFSLFIAFLLIVALVMMAVTEGVGTIIMAIFGIFISITLGLLENNITTTISLTIYLVSAGGIIIYKLTEKRQR